jgi:hypothetical protein
MIYPLKLTHEDRVELLFSAVIGAALGIVTGYFTRSGLFSMVIWAFLGAVVVSGMVYWLRALR